MSTGSVLEDAPPREALELHEGINLLEAAQASSTVTRPDGSTIELGYDSAGNRVDGGLFDAKGRVPIHVIRPGIGKGRGQHLYEASMLQENAQKFSGWRMFVNHQSPEAKRAAGGLPRDVRDLGGRVQESWWDGSVKSDDAKGHDQGAVIGMVRPVKFIRELIDDDPGLIEASISASATGVRPVTKDGKRCWLVEGINDRGSVDWVTEAGAGGRIAPMLQEAYAEEDDVTTALIEAMTDDELVTALRDRRPDLLQEAGDGDAEDEKDGGKDEKAEKVAELMKKGMPKAMAEKAAAKALSESNDVTPDEGGEVPDITPEALSEALKASPELLVEALTSSGETQVFIASLVEAKMEEERDTIRAEAKADVDRAFELARMERTAHSMIAEAKLPDSWKQDLRDRFSLSEANEPSAALDVVADIDNEGKVAKPAIEKLRESVEAEITRERERLREASTPTRVRSTAAVISEAKKSAKDDEDKEKPGEMEEAKKASGPLPFWAKTLNEAGINDPQSAYALEG